MLILTRRVGEVIKIGDEIDLIVLAVKGNQVRLGITAPKGISVHRQEIYERIQAESTSLVSAFEYEQVMALARHHI